MAETPRGVRALAAFFVFGAIMSGIACLALLFPSGVLEPMWQLNPESRVGLLKLGPLGIALIATVSVACALSALGLVKRSAWGYRLAIGVLTVNLVGDAANAVIRHDMRTLIGLPIGGILIAYLLRPRIRSLFATGKEAA